MENMSLTPVIVDISDCLSDDELPTVCDGYGNLPSLQIDSDDDSSGSNKQGFVADIKPQVPLLENNNNKMAAKETQIFHRVSSPSKCDLEIFTANLREMPSKSTSPLPSSGAPRIRVVDLKRLTGVAGSPKSNIVRTSQMSTQSSMSKESGTKSPTKSSPHLKISSRETLNVVGKAGNNATINTSTQRMSVHTGKQPPITVPMRNPAKLMMKNTTGTSKTPQTLEPSIPSKLFSEDKTYKVNQKTSLKAEQPQHVPSTTHCKVVVLPTNTRCIQYKPNNKPENIRNKTVNEGRPTNTLLSNSVAQQSGNNNKTLNTSTESRYTNTKPDNKPENIWKKTANEGRPPNTHCIQYKPDNNPQNIWKKTANEGRPINTLVTSSLAQKSGNNNKTLETSEGSRSININPDNKPDNIRKNTANEGRPTNTLVTKSLSQFIPIRPKSLNSPISLVNSSSVSPRLEVTGHPNTIQSISAQSLAPESLPITQRRIITTNKMAATSKTVPDSTRIEPTKRNVIATTHIRIAPKKTLPSDNPSPKFYEIVRKPSLVSTDTAKPASSLNNGSIKTVVLKIKNEIPSPSKNVAPVKGLVIYPPHVGKAPHYDIGLPQTLAKPTQMPTLDRPRHPETNSNVQHLPQMISSTDVAIKASKRKASLEPREEYMVEENLHVTQPNKKQKLLDATTGEFYTPLKDATRETLAKVGVPKTTTPVSKPKPIKDASEKSLTEDHVPKSDDSSPTTPVPVESLKVKKNKPSEFLVRYTEFGGVLRKTVVRDVVKTLIIKSSKKKAPVQKSTNNKSKKSENQQRISRPCPKSKKPIYEQDQAYVGKIDSGWLDDDMATLRMTRQQKLHEEDLQKRKSLQTLTTDDADRYDNLTVRLKRLTKADLRAYQVRGYKSSPRKRVTLVDLDPKSI